MNAHAEAPRGEVRRTISAGRKLLFSLGLALIVLVLLEGAVRVRALMKYGSTESGIVDSMLVRDPGTGFLVPKAGFQQHSENISVSINALGFRGDEITVAKPPRTIRIATIGASTTFCGEVPNEATWPAQLQRILQRAHPEVTIQVVNAGVPGYVVVESLANLRTRVLPLDPDLVIYYEANNDLAYDTRVLAASQQLIPAAPSPLLKMLSESSLLFDLANKNWRILAARNATDRKIGPLPADLPGRYIGKLDEMRQLVADRGIDFMLSTFLVKYRREQPRATQVANASIAFFYMPWMSMDGLLDGIDLYNNALVEYARSHNIPIVDDRQAVPGDAEHFVDWAHFSENGALKQAQRFARALEEQGTIRALIARSGA